MINGDTASEPLHVTALSDGLPYSLFVPPSFSLSTFAFFFTLPLIILLFRTLSVFSFLRLPLATFLFSFSHLLLTISSSRHLSLHPLSLYMLSPSPFLLFFTSLCCHVVVVQRPAAIVGQSEECQHHLSETRHQLSLP